MLSQFIHALVARIVAAGDAELATLGPELTASAAAANVKFGDVAVTLITDALQKLAVAEPQIAQEVTLLTPFILQYVKAEEPTIISLLGGEEKALVTVLIARAQQILAKI